MASSFKPMTVAELYEKANLLPVDSEGRALCAYCQAPARWGWIYKAGEVQLTTCRKCRPADTGLLRLVRIVKGPR
jgi:hypothetical protein